MNTGSGTSSCAQGKRLPTAQSVPWLWAGGVTATGSGLFWTHLDLLRLGVELLAERHDVQTRLCKCVSQGRQEHRCRLGEMLKI